MMTATLQAAAAPTETPPATAPPLAPAPPAQLTAKPAATNLFSAAAAVAPPEAPAVLAAARPLPPVATTPPLAMALPAVTPAGTPPAALPTRPPSAGAPPAGLLQPAPFAHSPAAPFVMPGNDPPLVSNLPEQRKRPASDLRDKSLEGLLEAHSNPQKRTVNGTVKVNLCAQLGLEASQQGLGRIGGKLAGHIGENKYVAGSAEDGRSKCQSILCRAYLAPGEPRIGKRAPSVRHGHSPKTKWYHIACIFASFKRTCKKSKTITSTDDLEGFGKLEAKDQQQVRDLISRHNAERAGRTTAKPSAPRTSKPRPPKPKPQLLPPPRRSGRTLPRSYDAKAFERPPAPEEGASLLMGLCAAAADSDSDSDSSCARAEGTLADAVAALAATRAPRAATKLPPATLAAAGRAAADAAEAALLAAFAGAPPAAAARAGAAAFEAAFAAIAARGDLLFGASDSSAGGASGGSSVAPPSDDPGVRAAAPPPPVSAPLKNDVEMADAM